MSKQSVKARTVADAVLALCEKESGKDMEIAIMSLIMALAGLLRSAAVSDDALERAIRLIELDLRSMLQQPESTIQ